ncbi:hypothetical protein An09g04450 [Aspergillus niger]|uniref:Uncharacterized protein n=2 Tax=Aspergillus niger TaxID=5061 RepID=A2QU56_ASPNC|nr:hypothetical protein An09g04450 [Aspergillus niger]CAK40299.1 hypothetical protein An09g04450 [Aspergillus niger]
MASAYLYRHISYWQQNMPRTTRCCTFGAIDKAVSKQASDPASPRPQVLTHQGLSEPVTQIRGSASGVDACHGMPRPYHQNAAGSLLLDLRTEMQDDPDVAPKYGYHPTKMTSGPFARYTHRLTGLQASGISAPIDSAAKRCELPPLAQSFVLRFQTHRRGEFRDRVGRSGDGRHAAPQVTEMEALRLQMMAAAQVRWMMKSMAQTKSGPITNSERGAKRGVPFLRSVITKISVGPAGSSNSSSSGGGGGGGSGSVAVSRTAHSNAALPRLSPGNASNALQGTELSFPL